MSQSRQRIARRVSIKIGPFLAEIDSPRFLLALNIIEPIARNAEYNILACRAHTFNDELQAVNPLSEKQISGSTSVCAEERCLASLPPSTPLIVLNPTLTPLELPTIAAGQRATKLLLAKLAHQDEANQRMVLPYPLMTRESSFAA